MKTLIQIIIAIIAVVLICFITEEVRAETITITYTISSDYIHPTRGHAMPSPTPPPQKKTTATSGVVKRIKEVFGKDASIALAIAQAESGLRCDAISGFNTNGTRDHGLFQINDINSARFGKASPYDCENNIQVAYQMFKSWGNWTAWSTFNNGSYLKFIN